MKRNKFALSNYKLLSCDMGNLVPIGLTEVLPGDTIQHSTSALVRMAPMLAPVMHPVRVRVHHWFVPHRLVFQDFEDFITGGADGNDASVFPTITSAGAITTGSLADYYGIPTGTAGLEYSALPIRGYNLIFNEWYRDQDLQTEKTIDTTAGPDTTTDTDLLQVAWEKDYFTSARPWEQKGTQLNIPIAGNAPVKGIATGNQTYVAGPIGVYETGDDSGTETFADYKQIGAGADSATYIEEDPNNAGYPGIFADLSSATGVSINQLREYLALNRFQEARARYGSRYTEYLRHLGVKSSDARLQRPEYLGGGSQVLQFSEVLQTAEGTNPVGEMRGHGIGALRSNRYRRFIEEHGYIHSFLSIKPKTMYVDGIPRTWNRTVKEDFWQKELQHIGQQPILNKELYAAHTTPEGIFGYQDRYDEYRRSESTIAGEFRDATLNYWHFARAFGSDPALNADFIQCVPTQTPFAASTNHIAYVMAQHSIQARRMVAKTGVSFIL